MRVHFIAIGGSAMHNLAIAMKLQGYRVTGSDDEIFEPSLSRLRNHGLLPPYEGWNPDVITSEIDAIVLGMHARADNPELLKAKELNLKIYSYPEFLYEQSRDKTRVVVGGSHGKTTITSMTMHVLRESGYEFDYMVGAQLQGFENMVSFSESAKYAIFEGDEYLTSPIDPRPKFHVYRPTIAVISGISWDHINVFPTFDIYKKQFSKFIDCIEPNGTLIFCADDKVVSELIDAHPRTDIVRVPYSTHPFEQANGKSYLKYQGNMVPLKIFGNHNMQNISAAKAVCQCLGVTDEQFYRHIMGFEGASKRLQLLASSRLTSVFLDFAHSPSKVKATVEAVRQVYPERKLIACFELHTFSSLNKSFLNQYKGTLRESDLALVYYSPHTLEMKKLPKIEPHEVVEAFGTPNLDVFTSSQDLLAKLYSLSWQNAHLLIMTSGNFSGVNLQHLAETIVGKGNS